MFTNNMCFRVLVQCSLRPRSGICSPSHLFKLYVIQFYYSINVSYNNSLSKLTRCGILPAVCVYLATFFLVLGAAKATGHLHAQLLHTILRGPMLFFETTPSGRIMSRFGKDVDVIDTVIPSLLEAWCKLTLHVLEILVAISSSMPYFLIPAVPLGLFYYFVQVCRRCSCVISVWW